MNLCCFCFFFSSRRRHTRFDCDWSSDVCSSDLGLPTCSELDCTTILPLIAPGLSGSKVTLPEMPVAVPLMDSSGARSEERRVGKSVDLGGRRIIKKKTTQQQHYDNTV